MAAGAAAVTVAGAALALWLTLGRDVPTVELPITTMPGKSDTRGAGEPDSRKSTGSPGDTPPDTTPSNQSDKAGPAEEPVAPVPVPPASKEAKGSKGTGNPIVRPPTGNKEGTAKPEVPRPEAPPAGQTPATPPPVTPPSNTGPEQKKDAEPRPTPPVVAQPPPVTVPAGPSDEEQVQATISRWARAYAARDARAVDEVQPGKEREFEEQFGQLRSLESFAQRVPGRRPADTGDRRMRRDGLGGAEDRQPPLR